MDDAATQNDWLWLVVIALLLAMTTSMIGCQTAEPVIVTADYQQQITACTQAINEGDLDQAKLALNRARPGARNFEQQRKVQSLDQLIAGSEAMLGGNVQLAAAEWSRIEDPRLARQIREKAKQIGVEVPAAAVTEKETAK